MVPTFFITLSYLSMQHTARLSCSEKRNPTFVLVSCTKQFERSVSNSWQRAEMKTKDDIYEYVSYRLTSSISHHENGCARLRSSAVVASVDARRDAHRDVIRCEFVDWEERKTEEISNSPLIGRDRILETCCCSQPQPRVRREKAEM